MDLKRIILITAFVCFNNLKQFGQAVQALALGDRRRGQRQRRGNSAAFFTKRLLIPQLEQVRESAICSGDIIAIYTNDPRTVEQWLKENVPSKGATLGFDVEDNSGWHTRAYKGPSTIQLAIANSCIVIQLMSKTDNLSMSCIPIMKKVLGDPKVVLAGVGIDQDMMSLSSLFSIHNITSRFDLGGIGDFPSGRTISLKDLAENILGLKLYKSKKLATSHWSRVLLRKDQVSYAALDAWVAGAVTLQMEMANYEAFGTEAIRERLQDEKSILEIIDIADQRKKLREKIGLSWDYLKKAKDESAPNVEELSKKVKELKASMKRLRLPAPIKITYKELGIEVPTVMKDDKA